MRTFAQLPEILHSTTETAKQLSAESISVWFVLVVLLFAGVVFWIFKLLLRKWERSEQHSTELQQQLLSYILKDQQSNALLLSQTNAVMGETVQLLESLRRERHDAELVEAARSGVAVVTHPAKTIHPSIIPDPRHH